MKTTSTRDTFATLTDMTKQSARTWYEIKNAASDTAEIYIYDDIGQSWFTDGVTAKGFINDLNGITAPNISLHLNSPGGSVFDGVAIFNALVRHPASVTTHIDGLAASIASIIALAGEKVVMAKNALFMIHNPWGGVQGDAEEMRKMADTLDKIRDTLVNTYQDRTGMSREDLVAALDAETWYTADEALAAGFVDEITAPMKAAASFDLTALGFKHAPQNSNICEDCDTCNCQVCECDTNVTAEAADSTDSEVDGSSASVTSDGASEDPTPEVETPVASSVFVPGLGFATFKTPKE